MMFIPKTQIEALSAEMWQRYRLAPGFDVERLLDDLGLDLLWEDISEREPGRVLGQLVPEKHLVVLNEQHRHLLEQKRGRLRRYTVCHEIGHWTMHAEAIRSGTLSLFDGERTWCRDGAVNPVERQAEMFAATLLIPKDQLLVALPKPPWRGWRMVYRLADEFLVNVTPMLIRLEEIGSAHRDEDGNPASGPKQTPGQASLFN